MFNTVESLYEKIQLYFTKWFLLRHCREMRMNESVYYTRTPFIGRFTCDSILISFSCKEKGKWFLIWWNILQKALGLTFLLVNHLEQSCPLHPGLQWHLLGRMHLPPFRQGEEHTAVDTHIHKSQQVALTVRSQYVGRFPHTHPPKHVKHWLTAVTSCARPPRGTVTLVGGHAAAAIQTRQDADSCHWRGDRKSFKVIGLLSVEILNCSIILS